MATFGSNETADGGGCAELLSTPFDILAAKIRGTGRAKAVWKLLRSGGDPWTEPSLSESTRRVLGQEFESRRMMRRGVVESSCGTRKLVLSTGNAQIESVVIPANKRTTICVSSQVGCARGCVFCCTAKMGLVRNLTSGEIVDQVLVGMKEAHTALLPPVRNVVFMGMGEPLDNLAAVERSISQLSDPRILGLGKSHITVSTVGPSPAAIRRAARLPARLAWSLHTADDSVRQRLIPHSRFELVALREAFSDRLGTEQKYLFVEVTLIRERNDSLADAERLAKFLEPLRTRVRVNLLRMNPGRAGLIASEQSQAIAFRQSLRSRGFFCSLRRPRGLSSLAACGQLVVPTGVGSPS